MVVAALAALLAFVSSAVCEADIQALAETSLELEQIRGRDNEILRYMGEETRILAQAVARKNFDRMAWCQLLSDQCTWLLQRGHAPLLARRLAYSLEQCSGTSQQLFDRLLTASAPIEVSSAMNEDDDEGTVSPSSCFARERAALAAAYLHRPHAQKSPRCEDMADGLVTPRHCVAHERLFVAFLACQAEGTP